MKTLNTLLLVFLLFGTIKVTTAQISFTKITSGAIATDAADSRGCAWIDIDHDHDIDLIVSNEGYGSFLYRNDGSAGFTKITTGPLVKTVLSGESLSCADFDNNGTNDVFICNYFNSPNYLFSGDRDGGFISVNVGDLTSFGGPDAASWIDYDNDGWLDMVATYPNSNNMLFHNNHDNTFSSVPGPIESDPGQASKACVWGDYDNDGRPDLFIANFTGANNYLYHNDGNGHFTKITSDPVVNTSGRICMSASWGDYDNDGWLDLFVSTIDGGNNLLYHNNGNGSFTRITSGAIVNDFGYFDGSTWSDFDNDGYLDLFVTYGTTLFLGKNLCYHNNGDGTFTKITTGGFVNEEGISQGVCAGDYNNDGFRDLFIANRSGEKNYLYLNNGNSNHWLKLHCVGKTSNYSAIGTRVMVKAVINGKVVWQIREVQAQSGYRGDDELNADFGLGDANTIDSLVIKWPAGSQAVFTNVPVDTFVAIREPGKIIFPRTPSELGTETLTPPIITIAPNPVINSSLINYSVQNKGPVMISISDLTGKKILTLVNQIQDAGYYTIPLPNLQIAYSGTYLCEISVDGVTSAKKIVVVK